MHPATYAYQDVKIEYLHTLKARKRCQICTVVEGKLVHPAQRRDVNDFGTVGEHDFITPSESRNTLEFLSIQ